NQVLYQKRKGNSTRASANSVIRRYALRPGRRCAGDAVGVMRNLMIQRAANIHASARRVPEFAKPATRRAIYWGAPVWCGKKQVGAAQVAAWPLTRRRGGAEQDAEFLRHGRLRVFAGLARGASGGIARYRGDCLGARNFSVNHPVFNCGHSWSSLVFPPRSCSAVSASLRKLLSWRPEARQIHARNPEGVPRRRAMSPLAPRSQPRKMRYPILSLKLRVLLRDSAPPRQSQSFCHSMNADLRAGAQAPR